LTKKKNAQDSKAIQMSGFRSASIDAEGKKSVSDSVTPLERRLYFSTAHFHLRGGYPALAVEVLSKLPSKVCEEEKDDESLAKSGTSENNNKIETGTLETDWSGKEIAQDDAGDKAMTDDLDWSAPLSKPSDDK
jgi:hypothetical protein